MRYTKCEIMETTEQKEPKQNPVGAIIVLALFAVSMYYAIKLFFL